ADSLPDIPDILPSVSGLSVPNLETLAKITIVDRGTVAALDASDSIFAVKIGGSLIGDFWVCLSDTEPFNPGDGLSVYRPSEIKALIGKGYSHEALQAVHRAKVSMEGKIVY